MDEEIMQEEIQGFVIDNDNKADWAIRKIAEARGERDRLVNLARQQIEDLKERIDQECAKCERKTAYLEQQLSDYALTVNMRESKTMRTYDLLSGKLRFIKAHCNLIPKNEALMQRLFDTEPDYLTYKVKWGDYKTNLVVEDGEVYDKRTGETITDVELEEVPEEFKVVI